MPASCVEEEEEEGLMEVGELLLLRMSSACVQKIRYKRLRRSEEEMGLQPSRGLKPGQAATARRMAKVGLERGPLSVACAAVCTADCAEEKQRGGSDRARVISLFLNVHPGAGKATQR